MLSCASVDAQRDYKEKHTYKAPKTLMYKGFTLAHTRAERARPCARARFARALPCGVVS